MNAELLRQAGEALYGPQWQNELSRRLEIADRTMRRWLANRNPIPETIATELRKLLKERLDTITVLRRQLR